MACELLVVTYGIQFPHQGWNPGSLLWEHGILAPGLPGSPEKTSEGVGKP